MSRADAALLVVDDNEDNRYALTRRLAREGYANVATAVDGRQALDLLDSRRFDLVLLDLAMPGDQEKALGAGCDDFDTKPVEMPRLLGKIRALVPAGSAP